MALFATRDKGRAGRPVGAAVPPGFEALADALHRGDDVDDAAAEAGRAAAGEGCALDEVLDRLTEMSLALGLKQPDFAATRAVSTAWADASLQYLHAQSCEDPLTGLATLAHIRSRLGDLYREADRSGDSVTTSHALTVIRLEGAPAPTAFDHELRLVDVAERTRAVYPGGEAIGRLGTFGVVAVARRDERAGERIALLRGLLGDWGERRGVQARIWLEGLPASARSAELMLDELGRL